ncbi:MAG: cytochrome c4 [Sulfuriferula multivorans]|uniref:Cytochrome c4 n=1 Tax=Sulfuriferula multivorans TaxID=1559896 RepID=A0A7C9P9B0_9PROT|nr:cytochrome c4 [Sulfuriferula multivorans]
MNKSMTRSMVLAINLLVFSAYVNAAPSGETIARQGNGKGAVACISCHGDKGQGNEAAGYPYLAGQPLAYLVKQLHDFANKRRPNPIMQPFASALSEDEIKAVASYYAQLPLPKITSAKKSPSQTTTGEFLAKEGKWSVGMPACFQCHGDQGRGIAPNFPAISGQPASYIKKQLEHWRKGERTNDPIGLMQAVVADLDESEITAVADYLSEQSPTTYK